MNATLTFTSSIGIAWANPVHFCTASKLRLEDSMPLIYYYTYFFFKKKKRRRRKVVVAIIDLAPNPTTCFIMNDIWSQTVIAVSSCIMLIKLRHNN